MTWLYVLAIVDARALAVEGPGAIRFLTATVQAEDDEDAYAKGADALNFTAAAHETANDYVIEVAP
jgi:hypothetical protein